MENQLLWNKTYQDGVADWFFVIVNYKREANEIEQRILRELSLNEEPEKRVGEIDGKEYRVLIAEANREPPREFLNRVYQGKKRRDPRLYRRQKGMDGLENYVLSEIQKT